MLKARPKLGEREVTLAHVTDWIEKKLDQEFQVRWDGVGSTRRPFGSDQGYQHTSPQTGTASFYSAVQTSQVAKVNV